MVNNNDFKRLVGTVAKNTHQGWLHGTPTTTAIAAATTTTATETTFIVRRADDAPPTLPPRPIATYPNRRPC